MPMEDYLHKQTTNKSLINILTQFFFRKTPTYFALGYFYVWLDYFYPKGGTGTLPKLIHDKVLAAKGKFKFKAQVKEIIPSKSKVIDSQGNHYDYDHLVWAADLKTLYKQLNTCQLDDKVVDKIKKQSEAVFASKPAESSFIMCLGVNRPLSYFEKISGAHGFYTPSKQGLGIINGTTQKRTIG